MGSKALIGPVLLGFIALSVFCFLATLVLRESALLSGSAGNEGLQVRIEGQPELEALFCEQGEKRWVIAA